MIKDWKVSIPLLRAEFYGSKLYRGDYPEIFTGIKPIFELFLEYPEDFMALAFAFSNQWPNRGDYPEIFRNT